MIHHISLPAQNPQHVAQVIAELFKTNYCVPFPSHPGSYVAFAGDEYGTLVEVYPLGTEMIPGKDDEAIQYQASKPSQRLLRRKTTEPALTVGQYIATHAAISIPLEQSEIEAIAQREQWRCVRCSRGYFDVIEFWLENTVLLELATPELAQQYTAVLTPENLAQLVTQS